MQIGAPLKLPQPLKMSSLSVVKPPKVPTPKIRAVKIVPVKNGLQVHHQMSAGRTQNFVFQNPKLMVQHLKRIESNEWLKPMQDPAKRITSTLDIGAPA